VGVAYADECLLYVATGQLTPRRRQVTGDLVSSTTTHSFGSPTPTVSSHRLGKLVVILCAEIVAERMARRSVSACFSPLPAPDRGT